MSADLTAAENPKPSARRARSEKDLRVGVEHALGATLQAPSLPNTKRPLSGSAGAVYGHAVIEYKRPGRLAEKGFPARQPYRSRRTGWRRPGTRLAWPWSNRRWTRRRQSCGVSPIASCGRYGGRWRSWGERMESLRWMMTLRVSGPSVGQWF